MAKPETCTGNQVEVTAQYLAGNINRDNLDPLHQKILDQNISQMQTDPRFSQQVTAKKNEICLNSGQKIPLFPDFDPSPKKRIHRKKKTNIALQPSLWTPEPSSPPKTNSFIPENKIEKVGKNLEGRYTHDKDPLIGRDIQQKKLTLRKEIGLPVARNTGKLYKFLVRMVYTQDIFGIFSQYDRVIGDTPLELSQEIQQVKELINTVLNDDDLSQNQRYATFNQFLKDYSCK
ncbi:hypothetical protein KKD37_01105 [Patescibacteria group bacterium]|nr:hypothetical protein [Patescibacteria group bacterium]